MVCVHMCVYSHIYVCMHTHAYILLNCVSTRFSLPIFTISITCTTLHNSQDFAVFCEHLVL